MWLEWTLGKIRDFNVYKYSRSLALEEHGKGWGDPITIRRLLEDFPSSGQDELSLGSQSSHWRDVTRPHMYAWNRLLLTYTCSLPIARMSKLCKDIL